MRIFAELTADSGLTVDPMAEDLRYHQDTTLTSSDW